MLLGSVLTVLGTLWAFYVKPVILRRRLGERRAEDRDAAERTCPTIATYPAQPAAAVRHRAHSASRRPRHEPPPGRPPGFSPAWRWAPRPDRRARPTRRCPTPSRSASAFASAVDLSAIRVSAVQEDGRVKTFDSLARERLKLVNSSRAMRQVDPVACSTWTWSWSPSTTPAATSSSSRSR